MHFLVTITFDIRNKLLALVMLYLWLQDILRSCCISGACRKTLSYSELLSLHALVDETAVPARFHIAISAGRKGLF